MGWTVARLADATALPPRKLAHLAPDRTSVFFVLELGCAGGEMVRSVPSHFRLGCIRQGALRLAQPAVPPRTGLVRWPEGKAPLSVQSGLSLVSPRCHPLIHHPVLSLGILVRGCGTPGCPRGACCLALRGVRSGNFFINEHFLFVSLTVMVVLAERSEGVRSRWSVSCVLQQRASETVVL